MHLILLHLQIRYNGWNKLFSAIRIRDRDLALKLLSCLEPTELLWGFPGVDMIADMRKYLEKNVCSGGKYCHTITNNDPTNINSSRTPAITPNASDSQPTIISQY